MDSSTRPHNSRIYAKNTYHDCDYYNDDSYFDDNDYDDDVYLTSNKRKGGGSGGGGGGKGGRTKNNEKTGNSVYSSRHVRLNAQNRDRHKAKRSQRSK